jgi:hypothetical protein
MVADPNRESIRAAFKAAKVERWVVRIASPQSVIFNRQRPNARGQRIE